MDESRTDSCCCCVFDKETNEPVPLKAINVVIKVQGFLVNVESVLSYENNGEKSIEAIFNFPVDENGAVYKFEMEIDGKTVVAECQEKEEAKKTYEEAVEEGYTASYLGENDATSDVFTCRLGNLHPNKKALVKFAYVSELTLLESGKLKFVLPTLLNPRYNPKVEKGGSKEATKTSYVKGSDQPYLFDVEVDVAGVGKILDVVFVKDKLKLSYENDNTRVAAKLSEKFIADHDFEFQITVEDVHAPKILIEKGKDGREGLLRKDVFMLNFFPSLKGPSLSHKHEFIFIIDRSGSMGGCRIADAKETLLLFLKSLPTGCYFNIIGFGSDFEALFKEESLPYSDVNLKTALAYQERLDADMGGTEILEPLQYVYKRPLISTHSRQVLLITDGEVFNTSAVIRLVQSNSHVARVFTLGIGEGASTSLVKGVARAGRGRAEFVKTGEKMQPVVMRLLKNAMQTSVTDVQVDWNLAGSPDVTVIPRPLPPIFDGDRLAVYAMVNGPAVLEGRVVLKGKLGEDELEYSIDVDGSNVIDPDLAGDCMPVHRMAAKLQIKELQDSENVDEKTNKPTIVALSLASNVVSNYTAMVGIDKEEKKIVDGCRITCNIPNILDPTLSLCGAPRMLMCSAPHRTFAFCNYSSAPMKGMCAPMMDMSAPMMDAFAVPEMLQQRSGGSLVFDAPEKAPSSPFLLIIGLAEFSGYWKFSDELLTVVTLDAKALKDSCPIKNLDAWTTAVVLSYFRIKCPDQKEEWEMIEMKALQWLNKQDLQNHSVEDLLKKAEKILN